MMTYALGRGVEATDRSSIDALVSEMKDNNHTFRSLIKGVIHLDTFLTK